MNPILSPQSPRSRQRGLTLLELLIVIVMFVIITVASGRAFVASLEYNKKVQASRISRFKFAEFEDRVRRLLQSAYLSTVTTDTNSFFIGGTQSQTPTAAQSNDPNTLTFTILPPKIPGAISEATTDFETNNRSFGPATGITEVSLSLTPVGQAPVQQGLFIRTQSPADSNTTQGGVESLLDADITEFSFEFWNGTSWVTDWNTQSQTAPRLPAAVRLTYRRRDENNSRTMVVRLIHRDVTALNPVATAGTQ